MHFVLRRSRGLCSQQGRKLDFSIVGCESLHLNCDIINTWGTIHSKGNPPNLNMVKLGKLPQPQLGTNVNLETM